MSAPGPAGGAGTDRAVRVLMLVENDVVVDTRVQKEALALAGNKAKAAAGALAELLKDGEKPVRAAAVYALGRVEPEAATTIAEAFAAMARHANAFDALARHPQA